MAVLTPARRKKLHRWSLRLEWFTVAWNVVEAVVAIGAGLIVGSVALVGFGVDSGIEVISAVALLWRLYRAGPEASAEEQGAAEKRALYLGSRDLLLAGRLHPLRGRRCTAHGGGTRELEGGTGALVTLHPHHADLRLPQGPHRARDRQQGACSRLSGDVGVRLPLVRTAGRCGPKRRLRLVVGGSCWGARDAASDRLAGVGDFG